MNKKETIDYWKEFLDISDWDIKTKKINPKAVVYDNQCPDEDKYLFLNDYDSIHYLIKGFLLTI